MKKSASKRKVSTIAKKTWHVPSHPSPSLTILTPHSINTQFDSDDEREARSAQHALSKKIASQSVKKAQKNQARLPRTAGLRTLSELTTELTKAGLDPSRIQERAEMLAKLQGAQRKRKRRENEGGDEDEDMDMDMNVEDGEDGWEDDGMDVDGVDTPKRKKTKANDGAVAVVVAGGRGPRTDRRLAGMRDEGVSVCVDFLFFFDLISFFLVVPASKSCCQAT